MQRALGGRLVQRYDRIAHCLLRRVKIAIGDVGSSSFYKCSGPSSQRIFAFVATLGYSI
jgi:hypothetical protein